MYRPLISFLLLAAAPIVVQAGPNDVCEVMLSTGCSEGCYRYVSPGPVFNLNCDETKMVVLDSIQAAPVNPSLDCKAVNGTYRCEAWPQSEDISYAWVGTQPGYIATDSINPFQTFSCQGGQVSVAVISPGGAASVATVDLPACN